VDHPGTDGRSPDIALEQSKTNTEGNPNACITGAAL
jgi:hypothetical protein